MKRLIFWQVILAGLIFGGTAAQAANTTGLADWCVNLDGDTTTACNGGDSGGASGNGSINLVSFDPTLEPDLNGLGSVTISLGAGANQYALFYADYDLDYSVTDNCCGSFDDSGATHGALPSGYSYSLNDPNASDASSPYGVVLFDQFYNNALDDTNSVPTPSGPPNQCCDVAFALGIGGLNVLEGGTGTVTFTIGTVAPRSGFYIQQTNATEGDSIYLTATANIQNPVNGTPEPSTFALGFGALGLVWFVARRRRVNA